MNVEKLRKSYDKLTPFERAALTIKEATGRQREAEIDALAPDSMYECLWLTVWEKAFFTVAAFAMFKACLCEKLFMQAAYIAEGREAEGREDAPAAEDVCRLLEAAAGWIVALKDLAEETGAPLLDAGKMLDKEYADNMLAYAAKYPVDYSRQRTLLRQIWNAVAKHPNSEDADRAPLA